MLRATFFLFVFYYVIFYGQIQAGVINAIAEINSKNATLAEALPQKQNGTSKYSGLLNKKRKNLETSLDAHKPVKYQLKDAANKSFDVNNILSEKALEAIGDAAMAEKLTAKPSTTSAKARTGLKGNSGNKTDNANAKCEN